MTVKQLESLYEQACLAVGYSPEVAQCEVWEAVLLGFSCEDLNRALREWWSDTTQIDWHGATRSKGSLMPMPADLLPALFRLKDARKQAKKFVPCHKSGCQYEGLKRIRVGDGPCDFNIIFCECRLAWEAAHGKLPT